MFRKKVIDYSDVYLQPAYSEVLSRDLITTNMSFLGHNFRCPVVPANMATTIDFATAKELSNKGYFYILHRFYDYNKILEFLTDASLQKLSISIGVKSKDWEFVKILHQNRFDVDFITIDVSHGHHKLVKDMILNIKSTLKCKVIAGNVTTLEACKDLKKWGADAVKVGIARGAACTTYNQTGVGTAGHFSTLLECSKARIPIIADGGIQEIGDISKALVGGASMVMSGKLFAACKDSPAGTSYGEENGPKIYYGSASKKNGNEGYIEGREIYISQNHLTYLEFLNDIHDGVKSTMSFGGFKDVKDLTKMKYIVK